MPSSANCCGFPRTSAGSRAPTCQVLWRVATRLIRCSLSRSSNSPAATRRCRGGRRSAPPAARDRSPSRSKTGRLQAMAAKTTSDQVAVATGDAPALGSRQSTAVAPCPRNCTVCPCPIPAWSRKVRGHSLRRRSKSARLQRRRGGMRDAVNWGTRDLLIARRLFVLMLHTIRPAIKEK